MYSVLFPSVLDLIKLMYHVLSWGGFRNKISNLVYYYIVLYKEQIENQPFPLRYLL